MPNWAALCAAVEPHYVIAAQNEEDGNRFLSLGLKRNQLAVTGSLKFDISVTPELAARR
ncbi:3-deoxy-D-manno-octulosonic-acid transferase [Klebsiella pneumoniae]|uniref:3-deoxy-D-manno-octulosonic-acid transferase n=1 Tax=Klebsiella pneumoniae TaxID=573 RepID=A0A378B7Z6_KLEPN|nr:3-deoxy-D-manno-octulosonic-acid transferase [Klebsiella pneumoniae]